MSETEFKVIFGGVLVLVFVVATFAFLWRDAITDANRWQEWYREGCARETKLESEVAILKKQIADVQRIFEGKET